MYTGFCPVDPQFFVKHMYTAAFSKRVTAAVLGLARSVAKRAFHLGSLSFEMIVLNSCTI